MVQKNNRTQRKYQAQVKPDRFFPPRIRQHSIDLIRQFFQDQHFVEIDTPNLLPAIPIEPGLYAFKTTWHPKDVDFYLSTSPESSLKKLIANGIGNCFSIAHTFRDLEDIGPTHNLEFSLLEWYEMKKDYHHIKKTTEKLITHIHQGIQKKLGIKETNILTYQKQKIDLTPPWHQFNLNNLFKKFAQVDLSDNLKNTKDDDPNWEPWFTRIMLDKIEPNLPADKPVFIFDYPTRLSPLCQLCPNQAGFSQRFELYIAGMEIGNAYTELTNAKILEQNFKKETDFRQKNNLPLHPYDQNLVKTTKHFPDCTGIALGVDRLAMLFANTTDINDVLYFSTKKLINSGNL